MLREYDIVKGSVCAYVFSFIVVLMISIQKTSIQPGV